MKRPVPVESASASIDEKIKELSTRGDWRGKTLAKVREIIHQADPEIVEEWKWVKPTSPWIAVWSHGGIVCTGETYKNVVKMTFAKGARLKDPSGLFNSSLFNSSLGGNVRRAIDIHEGDKVDEAALKDLIRAAVALNHPTKPTPGFVGAPVNHPAKPTPGFVGAPLNHPAKPTPGFVGAPVNLKGKNKPKPKPKPRRASSKRAN